MIEDRVSSAASQKSENCEYLEWEDKENVTEAAVVMVEAGKHK